MADDEDNRPIICPLCSKVVYFAERILGPDEKTWHRSCLIRRNQNTARMPGTFESDPAKAGRVVNPNVQDLNSEVKEKRQSLYDPELEHKIKDWCEAVVGEHLPSENFQVALKDGVFLCKLINKIKPGLVPQRKPSKIAYVCMETIGMFLEGCSKIGLKPLDCFMSVDLWEGTNMNAVLDCIKALGRVSKNIPEYRGPQLEVGSTSRPTIPLPESGGGYVSFTSSGQASSDSHFTEAEPEHQEQDEDDQVSITVEINE